MCASNATAVAVEVPRTCSENWASLTTASRGITLVTSSKRKNARSCPGTAPCPIVYVSVTSHAVVGKSLSTLQSGAALPVKSTVGSTSTGHTRAASVSQARSTVNVTT